jgi:hypothetical protein
VYSPVTRHCVFVGMEEGRGHALYAFESGKAEAPKRLEPSGHDRTMKDLALSPDGRYVVFASDRRLVGGAPGARVPSVDAPALSGITIDGDLADWPPAMPRHSIQNLQAFPPRDGLGSLEHAFFATSPDLSAAFSVGYDPKEQLIYLAVIVQDDELVVGNTSSWDSDAIEVYVDGLRAETTRGFPNQDDWVEKFDAGDAPVLQYIGLPGKGPVYGIRKSAGQERSGEENPILMFGDITKTKTRMAFRRAGATTIYEWAIQAFDHYPDKPTRLVPGMQIGFDVVVCDKDKPAQTPQVAADPEEDRAAWICWGPPQPLHSFKGFNAANLGEIVLGRAPR